MNHETEDRLWEEIYRLKAKLTEIDFFLGPSRFRDMARTAADEAILYTEARRPCSVHGPEREGLLQAFQLTSLTPRMRDDIATIRSRT